MAKSSAQKKSTGNDSGLSLLCYAAPRAKRDKSATSFRRGSRVGEPAADHAEVIAPRHGRNY